MRRLTKGQVLLLHRELIRQTGGAEGVINDDLLESALNAPFQSFDGVDVYPSLQQKGARLGYGLIQNHAFADGNKRIGAHVLLVFLAMNGIELDCTDQELADMALAVASGKMQFDGVVKWVLDHQM